MFLLQYQRYSDLFVSTMIEFSCFIEKVPFASVLEWSREYSEPSTCIRSDNDSILRTADSQLTSGSGRPTAAIKDESLMIEISPEYSHNVKAPVSEQIQQSQHNLYSHE
jgi:hypothetical protein